MFQRVRFVQLYMVSHDRCGVLSSRATLFAPIAPILELRCVGHKMLGVVEGNQKDGRIDTPIAIWTIWESDRR
jgi:hypothetical protein